ncbi:hypothetical protein [Janibacter alittae]|uniref:Secreted protein n=1 Tax=Janibacter alittae TaxID=3115209 RepID=A0ABZ2ME03_9MICO
MDMHATIGRIGGIVLAATLVTGCSTIADKAGEKVAEKGMEAAGGGDVDIDSDDDGKVTIESDEGSLEVGGDELPAGFPDEVPLPDDFEVQASMSMGSDDDQSFTVHFSSPDADVKQTHDDLKARAEAAGFEILSTNSMGGDDFELRSFTMSNDDWNANVAVSADADATAVNYTVMTPDEDQ